MHDHIWANMNSQQRSTAQHSCDCHKQWHRSCASKFTASPPPGDLSLLRSSSLGLKGGLRATAYLRDMSILCLLILSC